MPIYNHLAFLIQDIKSILSQTHTNFELIIINDGSTDGTQEFLQKLDGFDPKFHIIHQTNHGLPHALNKGFSEAKGALHSKKELHLLLH